MKQDFSELVEYLDKKFIAIDYRFEKLEKDFRELQTAVDHYAQRADAYFQANKGERSALRQ